MSTQSLAGHDETKTSSAPAFHYRDSVYFQDGYWLTGLLAGLLYIILAAALDAAGHVSNLAVVIPVTTGAFVLGLLMSFSRFDGFFALSHSMFVGLAWILYVMAQAAPASGITPFLDNGIGELQARVYFVLLRLLDWVDAAVTGAASADNYVFVFEICFLMWWLTYLGAWAIFRHGYTWRAIVPAGVVLLINTYYAPRPTIGFMVAFLILALILLVRTNLAEQQLRWRIQRIYFNQDIVWDFLRNGVLFSLLVVAAAWILPGLGRNPQMRQVLAPLNASWENTAQGMQRLYQGLNRQPQEVASSFGNSLALGGERNVGDSLLFQVQANRARYWRAVTFDTFDGTQWLNTATETVDFAPGTIVPVAAWRAREAISQTVMLLAPVGDVLFGAPDVAQSDIGIKGTARQLNGVAPIQAAAAPPGSLPVEFALLRAGRDLDQGDRYTFVSAMTDATVQDLNSAGTAYPADIVDRYIQIPPDFSPRVAELGRRLTEGATTPYAKAKAIEGYLRTIPYNDAIAAPPAGIDPLEYFLFDIQEGYCDYYAAAMAMMLRVAGVPARTASGYAEGTFDEESRSYFVTERDAHTWVEVYFPEYGWIEFEPTAGESPLNRPESDADAMGLTSQTEPEPQPESPLPAPTPPGGRDEGDLPPPYTGEDLLQGGAAATGNPPLPWWLWALMLLLLIPVGAFLILRARNSGPTAFTNELPVLLFERMQRWMGRLGLEAQTGQTPYEHARRVGRALPETQPHVDAITGSYVRFRFSRNEAPPAETVSAGGESLLGSWRLLEPLLWKAWLRRLRRRGKGNADNYRLLDTPGE